MSQPAESWSSPSVDPVVGQSIGDDLVMNGSLVLLHRVLCRASDAACVHDWLALHVAQEGERDPKPVCLSSHPHTQKHPAAAHRRRHRSNLQHVLAAVAPHLVPLSLLMHTQRHRHKAPARPVYRHRKALGGGRRGRGSRSKVARSVCAGLPFLTLFWGQPASALGKGPVGHDRPSKGVWLPFFPLDRS